VQRTDILKAAAQIFRQKGYHAASMQDIADAVQLQKASLYHHVESKQTILLLLLDEALDLLIEDMQAVLDEPLPLKVKFRKAMRVYMSRLAQDADLAAVLLLEHRSLDPERRKDHVARRDRYESLWRGLIKQGIEEGVFKQVDPKLAGYVVLGVQNWMITWYRPNGRHSPERLADQFSGMLLDGLAADAVRDG
jgi:AcrR family transcriptional regulator